MHYDALTAAAIAAEWTEALVGGRIDKVFQPDAWSLALLVRSHGQNWQVYLSCNPRFARAHLVRERKLGSGFDEPSAFVMLLRKHLESARITAIGQTPLERMLELQTSHASTPPRRLIIELLGRQSNAILVDEAGIVLGALRHVTAEMSRTRVVLPHRPYVPPPPTVGPNSDRLDPRTVSGESLRARLIGETGQPMAERLLKVLPISPTAAREAVFRAFGHAAPADADVARLAQELRELFAPLTGQASWSPTIARDSKSVVAFAAYPLRCLAAVAHIEGIDSISLAVERYFAPREATEGLDARRSRLRGLVRAPLERSQRRVTLVRQQLAEAEQQLALRMQGELLLAYQPELGPGQRGVELDDYNTSQPVTIPIDPTLTAAQNAQRLFTRYARAKRAMDALTPQLAEAELDAAAGRQAMTELALCETPGELVRLEADLYATGYLERRNNKSPATSGRRKLAKKGERQPASATPTPATLRLGDFDVMYGKTSLINDALTFKIAARQDLWLHAKGVPGSHVVIRSNGRTVPDAVLVGAAGLAAYLSDARGEHRAAVDYTAVANVRRQQGGKPGLVYYVGERTVQVPPLPPDQVAGKEEAVAQRA